MSSPPNGKRPGSHTEAHTEKLSSTHGTAAVGAVNQGDDVVATEQSKRGSGHPGAFYGHAAKGGGFE